MGPLVGGLMVRALAGNINDPVNAHLSQSVAFGWIVFGVFLVTIGLNFALVALDIKHRRGPLRSGAQCARPFIPLLPGQLAAGTLAALLAVAYTNLGLPVLFALDPRAADLPPPHRRAAALGGPRRAAGSALDPPREPAAGRAQHARWTRWRCATRRRSRHAAAVARYAKALAIELGCDEDEQDVIHTAGLLHDIGKFTWPDRVLHAEHADRRGLGGRSRSHPQDGADAGGQARRLRPGRRRDPLPPRAGRRRRLPGRPDRQRDPARLADPGDLLDLRHDDRARRPTARR